MVVKKVFNYILFIILFVSCGYLHWENYQIKQGLQGQTELIDSLYNSLSEFYNKPQSTIPVTIEKPIYIQPNRQYNFKDSSNYWDNLEKFDKLERQNQELNEKLHDIEIKERLKLYDHKF